MIIIPDLRYGEWYFADEIGAIETTSHLQNQSVLTSVEQHQLNILIDRHRELMGETLGCTDRAEHVIVTDSPPIKQRYYPVNPIMQKQIDSELNEMLKNDRPQRLGIANPLSQKEGRILSFLR